MTTAAAAGAAAPFQDMTRIKDRHDIRQEILDKYIVLLGTHGDGNTKDWGCISVLYEILDEMEDLAETIMTSTAFAAVAPTTTTRSMFVTLPEAIKRTFAQVDNHRETTREVRKLVQCWIRCLSNDAMPPPPPGGNKHPAPVSLAILHTPPTMTERTAASQSGPPDQQVSSITNTEQNNGTTPNSVTPTREIISPTVNGNHCGNSKAKPTHQEQENDSQDNDAANNSTEMDKGKPKEHKHVQGDSAGENDSIGGTTGDDEGRQQMQTQFQVLRERITRIEKEKQSKQSLLQAWRDLNSLVSHRGKYKQVFDKNEKRWIRSRTKTLQLVQECIKGHWQGDETSFCNCTKTQWPRLGKSTFALAILQCLLPWTRQTKNSRPIHCQKRKQRKRERREPAIRIQIQARRISTMNITRLSINPCERN